MELKNCKVSDIAQVSAGGDKPKIYSEFKTSEINVPIFSNGLENDGLYGYTNTAKIEADTVTVSARGVNIGTVCYRKEAYFPIVRLLSLLPNRELIDAKYLYYNLKNTQITGTGSAQPQVTIPMISSLKIKIHDDLSIQKKIAKLLTCFDDTIENNNNINRNLIEQIETIFRSWFVTFEKFSDCLEEGELGMQPKGWEIKTVDKVTYNIRDRVGKNNTEDIKVLSAVNTGNLIFSEDYFSKQVFSKDISKYILVEENDFAYNPARVNIGSIGINDLKVRGCVSPVYVVFRTEEGYENYFNYFIKTKRFKAEVVARATGSVRQSMNYSDFGLIEIIYPPKTVVDEFNLLIEPLQQLIENNREANDRLIAIREKLIPKLMSGEIDVSDLNL